MLFVDNDGMRRAYTRSYREDSALMNERDAESLLNSMTVEPNFFSQCENPTAASAL
jgi:hypothetical protein